MANTIKLGTDSNWAVKENNLLAYNDENNIFKPIDFEFTRDSGATRVNEQGLIENVPSGVPRIDFSDGKGSLLLEPQSTNLITYSEDLSGYGAIRGTLTLDASEIAPDGSLGVYYLTATSADGLLLDAQSTLGDSTFSVYVKRKTGSGVVELSVDGAVTKTPISVTNEWQRFSLSTASGLGQLVVNCETSGDEIYVWGLQAEEKSYATSYIPTSGATATRNAETSSKANISNLINSSEGVLYAEVSWFEDKPSSLKRISLSNGTISQRVLIYKSTSNNVISCLVTNSSNVLFVDYNYSALNKSANNTFKLAIKWKQNDFAFWVDGIEVGTSSLGDSPIGLDQLKFEASGGGTNWEGKVKDLRVYNTALTDTQLQQLTS